MLGAPPDEPEHGQSWGLGGYRRFLPGGWGSTAAADPEVRGRGARRGSREGSRGLPVAA
jgi:hypothetical protein